MKRCALRAGHSGVCVCLCQNEKGQGVRVCVRMRACVSACLCVCAREEQIHLSWWRPSEDETVTIITQRNYLIRCINN